MNHKFELVDGRIMLTTTLQLFGNDTIVATTDITDSVMPVVDDYLDEALGLNDYKYSNGKISYEGKDKGRYTK